MKVLDFLSEQSIKIGLQSKTKEEIIKEMIDLLDKCGAVNDKQPVIEAVIEREKTMTTGIGNGVAIPHGKSIGILRLAAALCIVKEGVDFESLDKKPVKIIVLLATPLGPGGPHIRALSTIARILNKEPFREKLISCSRVNEIIEAIASAEKEYSETL